MTYYNANVADILRASQRDEMFVHEIGQEFQSLLHSFGNTVSNNHRKIVPLLANCWYYIFTSLSNCQTLGEEYAGIIRVTSDSRIPSKLIQFIWLVLFVGGESGYNKLLEKLKNVTTNSRSLSNEEKQIINRYINFFKSNKAIFIRLHHALFYISGVYYNVSNNVTRIKYILLRQWMQSGSYTKSFNLLGKISAFYLLFNLVKDLCEPKQEEMVVIKPLAVSQKECALCGENIKNISIIPCGHLFCWDCVHDCIKYQNSCPLCREITTPSKVILLQNYV